MGIDSNNGNLEKAISDYGKAIYRNCLLMLKNKEDAEDVFQEVFYKYMVSKKEFKSEEHKKAWLFKVCQNKCINFIRFHKRHVHIPFEEIEYGISNAKDDAYFEDREELLEIYNLSYKLKSVVLLFYVDGYSTDEIAKILGISANAVRKRLQRAREELKMQIEEHKGDVIYEY